MKHIYAKLVWVGLLWCVACQPATVEPQDSEKQSFNPFLNEADTEAVQAFLLRMQSVSATRSTSEQQGDYYNNLGVAADLQGDTEQALVYHQQALAVRTLIADAALIAKTYHNMAVVYQRTGQQSEAFGLYDQAIGLFASQNKPQWQAHSLRNFALALQQAGLYSLAKEKYLAALGLWQQLGDAVQVAALQQDITHLNGYLGARMVQSHTAAMRQQDDRPPGQGDIIRFVEE